MKRVFILVVLLSLGADLQSFTWIGGADGEHQRATSKGAKTKMELHVVDDEGVPVSDVNVETVFAMGADFQSGVFKTDAAGLVVVEGVTTGNTVELFLKKESYYSSHLKFCYLKFGENRKVKDGKWQPWRESRNVVLRKIVNPKPIQRHCGFVDVPQTNEWIGLDMACGDWVRPYGKGVVADLDLMVQWDGMQKPLSRNCFMQVRMNGVGCGGTFTNRVLESEFPYPHEAETNDMYEVRSFFWKERENGIRMKEQSFWNQLNFVTRSRCVVDESGRVKEANYGCIRELEVGPGDEGRPVLGLHCVFNPTPNDTNLEDMDIAQRTYKQIELEKRFERERREKEKKTVWGGVKKMFGAP